jgi:cell division protease FtsH
MTSNNKIEREKDLKFEVKHGKDYHSFDQIGGYHDFKKKLQGIVSYLSSKDSHVLRYKAKSLGILLYGVPGLGKTRLAQAVGGEAKCPMVMTNGGEFASEWTGIPEKKLRHLFSLARDLASEAKTRSCLIVVDEIDSLLTKRSNMDEISSGTHSIKSQVNQFLTLLESLTVMDGVVLIGTTNAELSTLEPAMFRPGRISLQIGLSLPSAQERLEILQVLLQPYPVSNCVNRQGKKMIQITEQWTPSDLEKMVQDAVAHAETRFENQKDTKRKTLIYEDIQKAYGARHTFDTTLSMSERKGISFREAAKIIVARSLDRRVSFSSACISGRRGQTKTYPLNESKKGNLQESLDDLCIALAGRAVEDIRKSYFSGGNQDIQKAQNIATYLVVEERFGISTLSRGLGDQNDIEKVMQTQLKRSRTLLQQKGNHLPWTRLVQKLLDQEYLLEDDIEIMYKSL